MTTNRLPTWPLWLLAAPAGVAIWSGWVGLGGMTGFGPVDLLPGIGTGAHLNTAITLPVGMEVYAAYALRAWLGGDVPAAARQFAARSAIGALVVGAAGQIAYHLMAARHWVAAPWPVTIAVSCVPVAVLGMGAALAHLLRAPAGDAARPVVLAVDEAYEFLHSPPAPAVHADVQDSAPDGAVDSAPEVAPDEAPASAGDGAPGEAPGSAVEVHSVVQFAAQRARTARRTGRRKAALPPDWRICDDVAGCGCGKTLHRNTVRAHRRTREAAEAGTP
jgi:hypothetical protein